MPLGAKKTSQLWVPVVGKDGTVYKGLENASSLDKLNEMEPALGTFLEEEINKAIANGTLTDEKFKSWKEGFTTTKDGYKYKVVDTGDTYKVTRSKPGSGGGRYGGASAIPMRTEQFTIGTVDSIGKVINNQGPQDNYKITWIRFDMKKGDLFMLENQKQYTPTAATTTTETKTDKKEETDEQESE